MALMKIAGKTESGDASSFALTDEGVAKAQRSYSCDVIKLVDAAAVRDTESYQSIAVDVTKYSTYSLRIENKLGQDVTMILLNDMNGESTTYMRFYNGSTINIPLPQNSNGFAMLTPEELPVLQYLKIFHFRYSCAEAPTSGTLTVTLVGKG